MTTQSLQRVDTRVHTWHKIREAALAAPWTLTIAIVAVLAWTSPSLTAALELSRPSVADGQWWRLLTGHVTHFGGNHLLWDLVMFVVLGGACERRWPLRTRLTVVISAVAIGAAVVALAPSIEIYRGLSGLDSALFGLLATSILCENTSRRCRILTACLWLLLAGFAAKTGYELLTATTFFVDSDAAGFVPVPLAHIVGLFLGGVAGWAASHAAIGSAPPVAYDGRDRPNGPRPSYARSCPQDERCRDP